jgi:hypothetical protein
MPSQINFAPLRAVGPDGKGLPGALARFYETGSTTPITVYTDGDLGTAYAVPLVADAQGVFAPVFTDGATSVKVDVTTAAGVTVNGFPVDPAQLISSTGSAAAAVSFAPITGNAATEVQAAIQNATAWQITADDLGTTSQFASAAQGAFADDALPAASILNDVTLASTDVAKAPNTPSVKAYADAVAAAVPTPIKAWVNLDGTSGVTINASSNVSGVVRNAAGDYTVSFATNMTSVNYGVLGSGSRSGIALPAQVGIHGTGTKTVSAVQVRVDNGAGTLVDSDDLTIMILQ